VAEQWRFQHVPGGLVYKRRHANNVTRRLEALLPVNEALTRVFAERNPSLRRLVHRRLAHRYARVGHDCARLGQTGSALRHLGRSLFHAPLFWRAYMYLALLIVPRGLRVPFLRVGKRLYYGTTNHMRGIPAAR
jgi:hypothetical protein